MSAAVFVYRAPEGDSKVVEVFGHEFYDGYAVQVSDPHAIVKLDGNPYFERIEDGVIPPAPKKRGRPPKAASAEHIEHDDTEGGE